MTEKQDTEALVKRLLALAFTNFGANNELVNALTEAATTLGALQQANEAFAKRQEWWNEKMFRLETDYAIVEKDRDEWRESTILANKNAAIQEQRRHDVETEKAALQAKLDDAGRQEPVAWEVHFPNQQRSELVHDLDDLLDDMTNDTNFLITPVYTHPAPQAATESQLEAAYKRGFSDGMKEAPTGEDWVRVIDEAMVGAHIGVADIADDYGTAKEKLNSLICWSVEVDKELSRINEAPQVAAPQTPTE